MLACEHPLTARWKGVNAREHMYSRVSCVNHAQEHVAFACKHPLTARRKGVGTRKYILASIKFKSSGTVAICNRSLLPFQIFNFYYS